MSQRDEFSIDDATTTYADHGTTGTSTPNFSAATGMNALLEQHGTYNVTNGGGDKQVTLFIDQCEEILKDIPAAKRRIGNQHFIQLITNETDISAVIAIGSVSTNAIGYYVYLIEASGAPIPPLEHTRHDGTKVREVIATSAYFEHEGSPMFNLVLKAVKEYLPSIPEVSAQTTIEYAGMCTVPRNLDLSDIEVVKPFYDAATLSMSELALMIRTGGRTSTLQASVLSSSSLRLTAEHQISPGESVRNVFGELVASDFNITIKASPQNDGNNKQTLHTGHTSVPITNVNGYVDMIFTGPSSAPTVAHNPHVQQAIPQYTPAIIVTNNTALGLNQGISATDSLIGQLIGYSSVVGLATERRWVDVFNPSALGNVSLKTSFGVLGCETDPFGHLAGSPEEVNRAELEIKSPQELHRAVNWMCEPNIAIGFTVPHGSPMGWLQRRIAMADIGSDSYAMVMNSLDDFFQNETGFKFSEHYNGPILHGDPTTTLLGTFNYRASKSDTVERALSTIDYLTLLQYAAKDPNSMNHYMETYTHATAPGATVEARDAFVNLLKVVAPDLEITGTATQRWFANDFLSAIQSALVNAGISMSMTGLTGTQLEVGRTNLYGQNGTIGGTAFSTFAAGYGARGSAFTSTGMAGFNSSRIR